MNLNSIWKLHNNTAETRESTKLLNSRKEKKKNSMRMDCNLQFWNHEFHLIKQEHDQTLHLIQEGKSVLIFNGLFNGQMTEGICQEN